MTKPKPISTTSESPQDDRIQQLKALIPEAFSEGQIDFEKLREALGDFINDSPERYRFTWAGKRDALRLLQTPTRATLTPYPEESVDWETTRNIFIEGDNLEALKLMLKPYYGRVKMIYIDPPYNTGKDFIYPDNYADPLDTYLQLTGQKDVEGNLQTSNPETSGRYHSTWLSMMYPRLFLARQLLRDDGVIFVSIDFREVHTLRTILSEIFGEENFIADIAVVNNLKGRSDKEHIATAHEHLLMYSKSSFVSHGISLTEKQLSEFGEVDEDGERFQWRDLRKRGGADTREERPNLYYPIYFNETKGSFELQRTNPDDIEIFPLKSNGDEGCWRWGQSKVKDELERLKATKAPSTINRWNVSYRVYLTVDGVRRTSKPKSVWIGSQYATDLGQRAIKEDFPGLSLDSPPKAIGFIKEILEQSTQADDLCLDFFAGTCTLAQALYELNRHDNANRRFILVQLQEPIREKSPVKRYGFSNIAEIGKERIRRVIARLKAEDEGKLPLTTRETPEDLGFKVYKLAESNLYSWTGVEQDDGEVYAQQMEMFNDPLVEGWKAEDVICEVAIKEAGFSLNYRAEKVENVTGQIVYRVEDPEHEQHFFICLDERLDLENLRPLELASDELFICRAIALDDATAANLALQCRLKTI